MPLVGFPPRVFLIGGLRCGSTYLASLLDRHQGICLANPKEPGYFTGRSPNGLDWYRECFAEPNQSILIDATAWYSAGPTETFPLGKREGGSPYRGVAERIHSLCPDARFIYLIRDPIVRIDSLYWFLHRLNQERRPLSRAIREDPLYLRSSDYRGQLTEYLRFFPPDRFKLVSFDDLIATPNAVANACYRFFDLPEIRIETGAKHHERNASYQHRYVARLVGNALGGPESVERIYRGLLKYTPFPAHRIWSATLFRSKPEMETADREYVKRRLAAAIGEELLPVDGFDIVRQWEARLAQ